MKKRFQLYKSIPVALLLLIGFTGCKKYLDINYDPNRPTEPTINGILAATTQNTGLNVFRAANVSNYYVQYFASPNSNSPTDIYDRVDFSTTWRLLYDNMADIYDLEQLAIKNGSTAHLGMAKVMMAINLSLTLNMWGNIPFNEALSGKILSPKYDNAQDLHARCLTLLDEGIVELRKNPTITVTNNADFLHAGNRTYWIRTAFSMKARLLNQLSKTAAYNAANVLAAVDSSYTAAAQEAKVSVFTLRNPWATLARNNAALVLDAWLSSNLIQSMNGVRFGYVDPRISRFTDTTRFGDYRGTRNGAGRVGTGTNRDECYLTTNGFYSADAAPLFVITLEEIKFIEAEAALRASLPARAYTAYIAGITAHMNKLGISTANRDTYLARPEIGVGQGNLTLPILFREKYIIMFLSPEAWVDARRFNYAYTGFQLPQSSLLTEPIRRIDYPSTEQSLNSTNVPQVPALTQKLWWDQ
ncbi:SusD/RagB family nutrient-binding outer membrane lipoprotein [Lacibacter sp. H407]|uniref:SusD/RagB family nutrient-binding outer membrane lipoprotein n=1 Tax=Lacibacter sp. H407 TaxID=3133423 RepID=UPI0030BCA3D3